MSRTISPNLKGPSNYLEEPYSSWKYNRRAELITTVRVLALCKIAPKFPGH